VALCEVELHSGHTISLDADALARQFGGPISRPERAVPPNPEARATALRKQLEMFVGAGDQPPADSVGMARAPQRRRGALIDEDWDTGVGGRRILRSRRTDRFDDNGELIGTLKVDLSHSSVSGGSR
jgi:hypothetical protein